jgi:hypothetical protein
MNGRRKFLKIAPTIALPAVGAILSTDVLLANEGPDDTILGSWNSVHSLPFPPGSFREFVSFATGGVMHETNSFLHTASDVDLSLLGLPGLVNASDGVGNWQRVRENAYQVVFRKLLFDGSRQNFGDLLVSGLVRVHRGTLSAKWQVQVVDVSGDVLSDLGQATSEGSRLR